MPSFQLSTRRFLPRLTLPAAFFLTAAAGIAADDNWIAVVAPGLRDAIQPLIEQRKADGWTVTIIDAPAEPAPAVERIAALAAKSAHCCVVLAGNFAAESGEFQVSQGKGLQLRMKDQPTDYSWSANAAGLMLAVGRLPARSADEMRTMTRKILAWPKENLTRQGFPVARVFGGHHGAPPPFDKLADGLTNPITLRMVGRLPPTWRFDGAAHLDGSLWQVSGPDVIDAAKHMMSAPGTLFAYMGHSGPEGAVSKKDTLLSAADWRELAADGPRPGLFFTCGCHSCELDASQESYAMAAIRAPGGPPAVIGSNGESWSAMGYLAMSGLMDALGASPPPETLGPLWLGAQAGLAKGEISATDFAMFDAVDGSEGTVPLAQQRLEHLEMWMLLGDPAMPLLPRPAEIKIEPPPSPEPGKPLMVNGAVPDKFSGAALCVTFERHPGTPRADLPVAPATGASRLTVARERRRLSNDVVLASTETKAEGTQFSASLALPAALPDKPWTLRVEAADGTAAGVLQMK